MALPLHSPAICIIEGEYGADVVEHLFIVVDLRGEVQHLPTAWWEGGREGGRREGHKG